MKQSSGISKEEVVRLSKLAHVTITDEEIVTFQTQLSAIIEYMKKLNEIDTGQVDPLNQVTGLTNVMRDDATDKNHQLTQREALQNKPESKNNYFIVPAVFEKNE